MSILDNAVAHFDGIGTQQIKVPEWKTTIYSTPFTLSDKRKLLNFSKGDDIEFMVRALIMKAQDKKGKKLFDIGDMPTMMGHVDANVLARVVGEIAVTLTAKEAEEK